MKNQPRNNTKEHEKLGEVIGAETASDPENI